MKPLVIYHANCADGFGAAFAAWLKFGDEAEYLPMQYNKYTEDTDWPDWSNRDIYILDFSFPKGLMDWLFSVAKRVVWLDHHKTAFELYDMAPNEHPDAWADNLECEVDTKHFVCLNNCKSGALLAWEYFHLDKEVPMLIKHIDDYDRWIFKIKGTKEFNKALWSYAPWTFEAWNNMLGWGDIEVQRMKDEGAAILRAHEQNVQAVVKGSDRECYIWSSVGGYVVGLAANCPPHLASDVGHALATQSGTYGLLWYINKEGKCLCSLRSNGDYDVSAIAKAFAGGGHKNAAGFEIDIQTLLDWIK